jgi:S1-C subfamily serine protease|nr:PDZ domain-containing protein [Kofleriaceae bacterium]
MFDRGELMQLASALGGLPVLACRTGSPAEQAGVRYGDIVLAVNGIKTPDWVTFIEARSKSKTSMLIELFRDGVHVTITLALAEMTPIDPPELLAEILAERLIPLDGSPGDKKRGPAN